MSHAPKIAPEERDLEMEVSMDLEDDGGVALESNLDSNNDASDERNTSSPTTDEMISMYHQRPLTAETELTNLWRLPVAPLRAKKQQVRKLNLDHPIAQTYYKSCRLIQNHWRCEVEVCLPEAVRDRTLYSSALLLQLRRLASHTKQDFEMAQSLLLQSWKLRLARQPAQTDGSVNIVETEVTEMYGCESRIQENTFGLMLDDVHRALQANFQRPWAARRAGRRSKKQKNQMKRENTIARSDNPGSTIADRVVSRRR